MSTFMAKASELERKWYIIDATDRPLGRVAAQAASILRGKHLPTFTPHVDCGEFVIIINAEKAALTGKKLDQKYYYRHTGHVGGLKATKYRILMAEKPEKAVELAVWGMLPHNSIGRSSMKRLRVYRDGNHKQQAQKPEVLE